MGDKLRVGMIGTSWWADWMHLPSIASHPAAQWVAICGRTAEPAQKLADKYGIGGVFADYRELLAQDALDAVVVATPDDTHVEIAMAALDRGLHLLCEKPLANTLAEAEQIARRADAAGVRHMTLFSWRWAPVWAELKRQLDAGAIGRPLEARFAFLGNDAYSPDYRWRRDGARCNGALADFGAHMIDFVRWYLGEVDSVGATISTHIDRSGIEPQAVNDCATLDVVTRSGAHAILPLNMAAHIGDQLYRIDVEIFGDQGSFEGRLALFGSEGGARLRRCSADQAALETVHEERFPVDFAERPAFFAPYVESSAGPRAFIDAIIDDRPATPNLHDGVAAQRVIDAAIRSQAAGCRVKL